MDTLNGIDGVLKMEILHYMSEEEAEICQSFLLWQGYNLTVKEDGATVLKTTKGRPSVIINFHKETIIGFQNLVEYWNRNGLWRI